MIDMFEQMITVLSACLLALVLFAVATATYYLGLFVFGKLSKMRKVKP